MTAVPWIMVPAMLVSLCLLIHLTMVVKLRSLPRTPQAMARAGEGERHASLRRLARKSGTPAWSVVLTGGMLPVGAVGHELAMTLLARVLHQELQE
jgi:hypothetical protein